MSTKVPRLNPGQTVTIETLIPTARSAEEEMIAIRANVGDLSMRNDQLWFMTKEDIEELQGDLEERGRPADGSLVEPPVDAVEFAGEPKLGLVDEWLVATITARTNLRDPTEELALLTVRLRHENEELSPDAEFIPQVWFISVLGEGVRPAAKTYMDLKVSEICEKAKLGTPSPVLEFTVVADDASKRRRSRAVRRRPGKPTARPRSRSSQVIEARISAEFDEALTKKLHRICTGGGPAGAQRPH